MNFFYAVAICLVALLSSAQAQTPNWLMQDVSVLFPAPKVLPDPDAFTVKTTGAMGEFLPAAVSKNLPLLAPFLTQTTQANLMQVVGVRFDPPEVRLVWQIFQAFPQPSGRIKYLAVDGAVHTFYKMTDPVAFMAKLKQVNALSRADLRADIPLGVHPTLAASGWSSAYGQELKKLILSSVGEKNLFKMTFMALRLIQQRWDFGGFTYDRGQIGKLDIPKTGTNNIQVFVNSVFPPNEFLGGIGFAPRTGQDAFNRLISDSSKAQVKEDANLTAAHFTSRTLENPNITKTAETDCVSCHLAQMARYWTEAEAFSLRDEIQNRFTSSIFNLSNKSLDRSRTDNTRAFGYFSDAPAISQRAINESAQLAEKLNSAP